MLQTWGWRKQTEEPSFVLFTAHKDHNKGWYNTRVILPEKVQRWKRRSPIQKPQDAVIPSLGTSRGNLKDIHRDTRHRLRRYNSPKTIQDFREVLYRLS